MPHDERMLKSAFKSSYGGGKTNSLGPMAAAHKRGPYQSQTPYVNKTFDMKRATGITGGNPAQ